MKRARDMMGMPINVEIVDSSVIEEAFDKVFSYFRYIDDKFSTYKSTSEISHINKGLTQKSEYSHDMNIVFSLAEQTRKATNGYFDIISRNGTFDPSGLVKGWAIYNAAKILDHDGFKNYYIEAGGDIQVRGNTNKGQPWTIGIKNPLDKNQIIKVISVTHNGIATSGTYIRGQHIYNPHNKAQVISDILSLTVIGPNVYEADRFATAAFAMGRDGILFIENLQGFEGYMIDKEGIATMTTGFESYVQRN